MNRWFSFASLLLFVALVAGCGGSPKTAPVAEQDALSKWVAENPSPPETPTE